MIVFENKGEIDPRLITTLGLNVKETDNPIGYFGTGLKYALAVLLREGHAITIQCGKHTCAFHVKPEEVRGKSFDFIVMVQNGVLVQKLGFTTELGKNWTLREAYRELHCNALDEGNERGGVELPDGYLAPVEGITRVIVTGEGFTHVHVFRDSFILNKSKLHQLHATKAIEVFLGKSKSVFYRGVKVFDSNIEFEYTYNILAPLQLSEDRLASEWEVECNIRGFLVDDDTPPVFVLSTLAQEGVREQKLDFGYSYISKNFASSVKQLIATKSQSLNKSAIAVYYKGSGGEPDYEDILLTSEEGIALNDARAWCLAVGFDISPWQLRVVRSLGERVLAKASSATIFLTRECFERGLLREVLIEEHIHLAHHVADETRDMQNVLFGHLVRLGSELIQAKKEQVT